MNSNGTAQLIAVVGLALLMGVNQVSSGRRMSSLEERIAQLQVQLAEATLQLIKATTPQPDGRAQIARATAPRPEELKDHARHPEVVRQEPAAHTAPQPEPQTAPQPNPAPEVRAESAYLQLTRLPKQTDEFIEVMTDRELETVFAGAGIPTPGAVPPAAHEPIATQAGNGSVAPQDEPPPRLTPRVEKGGVLLPKGKLQIEPTFSYSHTSNNRVGLSGFSVIDVIFIGEIRAEEIDRDLFTASLSARYGLTNNLQVEGEIPMQYQREEQFSGPIEERRHSLTTGHGFNDMSAGLFYQFMHEGARNPSMIAHMKLKAPTGKTPGFGSGAWGVKTGLLMVRSTDPVVLFSNMAYTMNLPTDIKGVKVNPGNAFEYSVGAAYALNYNLALNASLEQIFIGETTSGSGNSGVAGSRLIVANLKAGMTYALSRKLSMDFSVGAGLTEDSPDFSVSLSFPYTF
jgi:hypothetical protein